MANYTSVIASNICDAAGNKLASGTVSFQATDAANQPTNFQVGGGGQVVTTPTTAVITNGAIAGGFQVADSSNTLPAGILYRITVTDTTLNRVVIAYSLVSVTGTTFNLDNYVPVSVSAFPPLGGTIIGSLVVTGNLSVTGTLQQGELVVGAATINDLITTNTPVFDVRAYGNYPSGTLDQWLNAAVTACVAAGGGVIDASALSGLTQTIAAPVTLGDGSTFVGLKLPNSGTWNVTSAAGSSFCGIMVKGHASMVGPFTTGGGDTAVNISSTSATNLDSLVCTDPSPSGGGSYVQLSGFKITSWLGTFASAPLHIQKLYDGFKISDIKVSSKFAGDATWFHNLCCGGTIERLVVDCNNTVSSRPVHIGKTGGQGVQAISFIGGSAGHGDPALNDYFIEGGSSTTGLLMFNNYSEGNTATPQTAANIGFSTDNVNSVSIIGFMQGDVGTGTNYAIERQSGNHFISIKGLSYFTGNGILDNGSPSNTVGGTAFGTVKGVTEWDSEPVYIAGFNLPGVTTTITGATGTGANLVRSVSPSFTTQLSISDAAATNRTIQFQTAGVNRWLIRANSTAESGSNVGTDLEIVARDDSGALLSTALSIVRSTGIVSVAKGLTLGSTVVGSLPSAASNAFMHIGVTDSTAIAAEGQTCVGGGSVKAIAISNGSVWKCF